MHPSFQVFSQCLPGDGESVPVDQLVLQQIMQDHCTRAAKGIGSVNRIKDSNNETFRVRQEQIRKGRGTKSRKRNIVSSRKEKRNYPKMEPEKNKGRTGYSTNLVHVLHNVLPTRFEIRDEWNTVRYRLEIVDCEVYADRMSDSDKMEHGVGRTSEDHRQHLWHNHRHGRMRTAEYLELSVRYGPLRSQRRLSS